MSLRALRITTLTPNAARTAVHFQDVTEKYSPYETLLEIKTAEGLNDTSLAASFKLHTASPSASSSRLDEISEDAEDGGAAQITPQTHTPTGSHYGSQRSRMERRADPRMRSDRSPAKSVEMDKENIRSMSPLSSPLSPPGKTSVSQFLMRSESGQPSITSLGNSSLASMAAYKASEESMRDTESIASTVEPPKHPPLDKPLPSEPSSHDLLASASERLDDSTPNSFITETRKPSGLSETPQERLITSERTSTAERPKYDVDPYDFSQFEPKPKVKLGPRPVAAAEKSKRPSISSVPATYKPVSKKQEQTRPKSQGPSTAPGPTTKEPVPLPPPIPDTPEYNPRPLSRGSIKSLPSHKSSAMTPDKLRLMKAVELRKKQMRKSNPQAGTFVPPAEEKVPDVPKVPDLPKHEETQKVSEDDAKPAFNTHLATVLNEEQSNPPKKADSGIEMDYDKVGKQEDDKAVEQPPQPEEVRQAPYNPAGPAAENLQEQQQPTLEPSEPDVSTPPSEPLLHESQLDSPKDFYSYSPVEKNLPKALSESPNLDRSIHEPLSLPSPTDETAAVPTIVMADGSRPLSSGAQQPQSEESSPTETFVDAPSGEASARSSAELRIPEKNSRRQNSDLARRRRGYVQPLHLDEAESASDDEFIEELQSATVQNATPITVSRSPMAQYFQRQPSATSVYSDVSNASVKEVNIMNRSSTMPTENSTDAADRLSPEPTNDMSRGTTSLGDTNDQMAGMKRTVSSGISKRIQALAEQSSRESSPQSPESWANGILAMEQKAATRSPPRSRTSSFKNVSRHSARVSSISSQSTAQPSENAPVWNVQHDSTANRDSVSVAARIIRPTLGERSDSMTGSDGELQQSQLVINHKRGTPSQSTLTQLHRIDTNTQPITSKRESGSSRGVSPIATRASKDGPRSLPSLNETGYQKAPSPTAEDFPVPPAPTYRSGISSATTLNDENAAPKESSRASRFFKRMSNLGGKRRSVAQNSFGTTSPVSEHGSLSTLNMSAPSKEKQEMPPALVVGDLNIQFPDSLVSLSYH